MHTMQGMIPNDVNVCARCRDAEFPRELFSSNRLHRRLLSSRVVLFIDSTYIPQVREKNVKLVLVTVSETSLQVFKR